MCSWIVNSIYISGEVSARSIPPSLKDGIFLASSPFGIVTNDSGCNLYDSCIPQMACSVFFDEQLDPHTENNLFLKAFSGHCTSAVVVGLRCLTSDR